MPRSGNFADVYQVRAPDGHMWALKCFTRPASGLRELPADRRSSPRPLAFSVGFQFLPEGVFAFVACGSRRHKMEWVEGLQLNQFVRENADKPEASALCSALWVRCAGGFAMQYRPCRLAAWQRASCPWRHGQHAQTAPDRLRRRHVGTDPRRNPSGEAGHQARISTARLRGSHSADVDRFPHLVWLYLRALAVAGQAALGSFDSGDNMLFREVDLADPANSPLFKAL